MPHIEACRELRNAADVVLVLDSDAPWVPSVSKPNDKAMVFHIDVDPLKQDIPLCCATANLNAWEGRPAWQLRGMAVAPTHQRQGAGQRTLADVSETAAPWSALKPVYDAVMAAVAKLGKDVELAPKLAYMSVRRSKQFACVHPSTKSRLDLLREAVGDEPAQWFPALTGKRWPGAPVADDNNSISVGPR